MLDCICGRGEQPDRSCCKCCCGQFESAIAEKLGKGALFAIDLESAIGEVIRDWAGGSSAAIKAWVFKKDWLAEPFWVYQCGVCKEYATYNTHPLAMGAAASHMALHAGGER